MGFLLVPLFVSAVFFLAVFLRDLRGDFRERTHYFEDLDEWKSPPPETQVAGGGEAAAPPQARDSIQRNLVWWLALPASISLVLSAALTWPYLLAFLVVCGFILSVVFPRIIVGGLVAVTALAMMVAFGMLRHGIQTERHSSEPRVTLMVIPFEALVDDARQRSIANTLNEGLKRELASWDGLEFIPVKAASIVQRRAGDADQRDTSVRPRYALEGSVLRSNERVTVQAKLFDPRTARDVWSAQLNADPADHSKILAMLTSGVASALDDELAR